MPDGIAPAAGDIVRVPLGSRDVFAYVLGAPYHGEDDANLRDVIARVEGPRAFDATGLELARWIADQYVCSLREALGAVVLAAAIPRAVERFVPKGPPPDAARFKLVPDSLIRLLWKDFIDRRRGAPGRRIGRERPARTHRRSDVPSNDAAATACRMRTKAIS